MKIKELCNMLALDSKSGLNPVWVCLQSFADRNCFGKVYDSLKYAREITN